jgi:CRISPR-associated exonuclease Cas4
MASDDERLITLSALQHYAFCPRQCALIHNEQAWADNFLTAQGNLLHERVDGGEPETRKGVRFERGVHVSAPALGLTGKLDLVEKELATGQLFPVEYKRGKPKPSDWDEIQLCAQALCLEEMTGYAVTAGALWYHQTRHRLPVQFGPELRENTCAVIAQVRLLLCSGTTPKPVYGAHCQACSLVDLCNPRLLQQDRSRQHIHSLYVTDDIDEETAK